MGDRHDHNYINTATGDSNPSNYVAILFSEIG